MNENDIKSLNGLYSYYITRLNNKYSLIMSESEFNTFFNILYERLVKLNYDCDIVSTLYDYLELIVKDTIEGHEVDIKWCIDHLWYLKKCNYMYGIEVIKFQDKLIKELNIKENAFDRMGRKSVTKLLVNRI